MGTRVAKKPKILNQERESIWPLKIDITSHIISFIPFDERSAIFQSCKFLSQVCFNDFWSSNISIEDYLNFINSLSCNLDYEQDSSGFEQDNSEAVIQGIFKSGQVNEIKLLCRHGQSDFISDYLCFVPSESFYEILRWSLSQMGINQLIFEDVARECCLDGVDEIFELLVSGGLYKAIWLATARNPIGCGKLATFLFDAASSSNIRIVRNLIDNVTFTREVLSKALNRACDPVDYDEDYEAQFNWPISNQDNIDALAVVKLLVSKGADLNFRDFDTVPPLLGAFRKGNLEVVDYLLEKGANIHNMYGGDDILSMATYSLSVEAVEKALQLGFIHNINITGVKYLQMLLRKYRYYRNGKEEKIMIICKRLIEAGAKVDGKDEGTIGLLICSCDLEMLEVIKLFASHGADYNLFNDRFEDIISPLHAAIYAENLKIVKYLVNDLNVSLKRRKKDMHSPLFHAATKVRSREITTFLLEAGATASRTQMKQIKCFLDYSAKKYLTLLK